MKNTVSDIPNDSWIYSRKYLVLLIIVVDKKRTRTNPRDGFCFKQ